MVAFSARKALASLPLLAATLVDAQASTSAPTASATTSFRPLFSIPASADDGQPIQATIYDPKALNPQDVCPGYKASDVTRQPYGLTATLALAGTACNVYGNDVDELLMTVEYQSADRLHIDIVPKYIGDNNQTWFVPPSFMGKPGVDADAQHTVPLNDLDFVYGNTPSFWFKVIRKSVGEVLINTEGSKLVFEDQFVEFATPLPEDYNLYGLGETIHALRLGNNFTKTMYASDNADTVDRNIYGTHPIYYETRYYEDADSGNLTYVPFGQTTAGKSYKSLSHAVYYRNAHAHEILLQPEGLTWRTLGGNLELYVYSGPTIEEAAKSYQSSTIGLPAMQQYFTFGYHQCRWGYVNVSEVAEVVQSFEDFGIPLENMWTDIDYMGGGGDFRDFTTDPERYPLDEFQPFLEKLAASGRHYIPIVDSAIYIPNPDNATDAYPTYTRGHEVGAFMLNPDGSEYIGAVWPGYTVFPDWIGSGANDWWVNEFALWYKNVSFSGIWIDMSEVSSFCVGSCGSNNLTLNPAPGGIGTNPPTEYPEGFNITNATEAASVSAYSASLASASPSSTSASPTSYLVTTPTAGSRNINYPPYAINNYAGDLAVHAASPNATHHDALKTQEYDHHNLFGWQILNSTYNALANVFPGKRPFIIGRSTFAGAGAVAGHWGGDNFSLWTYMAFAIPQALSFSLFGIPMFGVDTCGFNGNTDEELCNRWMMVSAFYPFYRNHNTIYAISQEPYRWSSVIDATKTAMDIRYALLPYMYTLMETAHETGSTVMRALAWEFPNEPMLAAADRQFMLGPSILITPVLEQGATTVDGVFPGVVDGTMWYDWYNQSAITSPGALAGQNTTLPAPLSHIPVFVRGGSVLPMQPLNGALTTRDARQNPWALLVGLDKDGAASGDLYLDDGESVTPNSTLNVNMVATNGSLYATGRGLFNDANPLANVTVMGVSSKPNNVTLNGMTAMYDYDETSQLLKVTALNNITKDGAWSSDWQLSWA